MNYILCVLVGALLGAFVTFVSVHHSGNNKTMSQQLQEQPGTMVRFPNGAVIGTLPNSGNLYGIFPTKP